MKVYSSLKDFTPSFVDSFHWDFNEGSKQAEKGVYRLLSQGKLVEVLGSRNPELLPKTLF